MSRIYNSGCTLSHQFVFNDGQKCCSSDENCDSNDFGYNQNCCVGESISCPSGICLDLGKEIIKIINTKTKCHNNALFKDVVLIFFKIDNQKSETDKSGIEPLHQNSLPFNVLSLAISFCLL